MALQSQPGYAVTNMERRKYYVLTYEVKKGGIDLTHNQIEFWKLQEDKQHNRATEAENARHNLSTERQTDRSIIETIRHNKAGESLTAKNLNETIRHNRIGEVETQRHNVAVETETNRTNLVNEGIKSANLTEYVRHNKKMEGLEDRNVTVLEKRLPAQNFKDYGSTSNSVYDSLAKTIGGGFAGGTAALGTAALAGKTKLQQIGMSYYEQAKLASSQLNSAAKTIVSTGLRGIRMVPIILKQMEPKPIVPSGGSNYIKG